MVLRITDLLDKWTSSGSGVSCIVIRSSNSKAFCSGGDVKSAVLRAREGQHEDVSAFFDAEYALDLRIARCRLPYVALIDGIVMGGGAGLCMHGHFRVATDRTLFAMPECGIGLYPDVGASFFLSKLPARMGLLLGLTGLRLRGPAVYEAGLATHYVPHTLLDSMQEALHNLGPSRAADFTEVARTLDAIQATAGPCPYGTLASKLLPISDLHFGRHQPSVEAIVSSLQGVVQHQHEQTSASGREVPGAGSMASQYVDAANEVLLALLRGSPLSQKVTFELMHRAAHASLETCLRADGTLVRHFVRGDGDFFEGVRAALIDRSRPPQWKFSSAAEVPDSLVESFFADSPFAHTPSGEGPSQSGSLQSSSEGRAASRL
ncbi:ClpP/crotonase-like domain-containing protein [Dunaliella salina]|uniref:3-hydroxyisobutyryl-CoA hydrolase n=1 Tax=Dunaliella salina TaxID=3046 RepID=A0ABZ3KEE4_DUNSA|nr:ClpP/crotonase-like domain-containing protein [Dunaliella salina]|eukprot:KAF5827542.1 ClpP/crotonase-like domain-containing protein [Dunaliella salina]